MITLEPEGTQPGVCAESHGRPASESFDTNWPVRIIRTRSTMPNSRPATSRHHSQFKAIATLNSEALSNPIQNLRIKINYSFFTQ
jgi:hypothetical protein